LRKRNSRGQFDRNRPVFIIKQFSGDWLAPRADEVTYGEASWSQISHPLKDRPSPLSGRYVKSGASLFAFRGVTDLHETAQGHAHDAGTRRRRSRTLGRDQHPRPNYLS